VGLPGQRARCAGETRGLEIRAGRCGGRNAESAIDLSAKSALQNVGAGTNVTFRIVNFGASGAGGTWYVYDHTNSAALDLAVQGSVIPVSVPVTNPPAAPPSISLLGLSLNQFHFTLLGTTGTNYVVEVSTNLAAHNWVPLITNPAPFLFTETNTNTHPRRFFRGRLW
jgi:hypothetical protein